MAKMLMYDSSSFQEKEDTESCVGICLSDIFLGVERLPVLILTAKEQT